MAIKQCIYCGKQFSGRADAKFCVDNFGRCRGAYHRLKKRAAKLGYTLPDGVQADVFDMDVLTAVASGIVKLSG